MSRHAGALALLAVWLLGSRARADDLAIKQACVDAHADAQQLALDDKPIAARERLAVCLRPECPGAVRAECQKLLVDLDAATPRLLVEVYVDGATATAARVLLDGAAMPPGEVAVAPGEHLVRVELTGHAALERRVVLAKNDKRVMVRFDVTRVTPPRTPIAPAPRPMVVERPIPVLTWALAGAGIVTLGTAGYFAHVGRIEQARLESGCAPACDPEAAAPMRRAYLVADVALGVSVLALGGAAWSYVMRPTLTRPQPIVQVGAGSMGIAVTGSF